MEENILIFKISTFVKVKLVISLFANFLHADDISFRLQPVLYMS